MSILNILRAVILVVAILSYGGSGQVIQHQETLYSTDLDIRWNTKIRVLEQIPFKMPSKECSQRCHVLCLHFFCHQQVSEVTGININIAIGSLQCTPLEVSLPELLQSRCHPAIQAH